MSNYNSIVNVAGGALTGATTNGYSLSDLDNRFVNDSGDTMTGNLDLGNFKIINLATPTNNTDVTNKNYVDTQIYTTSGSIGLFPIMTSNILPSGWIASASSEFSAAFAAYKVTNIDQDWATLGITTNYWVQIQSPTSYIPVSFSVRGRISAPNNNPATWKFNFS